MTTHYAGLWQLLAIQYPFTVAQGYDRQLSYRTAPEKFAIASIHLSLDATDFRWFADCLSGDYELFGQAASDYTNLGNFTMW